VQSSPPQLLLTLLLPSPQPLGKIVDQLETVGESVSLSCLVGAQSADGADPTVVDRGRLTDRQREVLEIAYSMGYFAYPREADASQVAEALDISRSTFAEHLATAQHRLLAGVLDS